MSRIIIGIGSAFGLLSLAGLITPLPGYRTGTVEACSLPPPSIERSTAGSDFVGIVQAVSVGSDVNSAPTVTPTATPSPAPTLTPDADATATATALASATPAGASPTPTSALLAGRGATLAITQTLKGQLTSPFDVDAEWRRDYEEYLRGIGSDRRTSCDGIGPPLYEAGARYVVFVKPDSRGGLYTAERYPIEGDQVVVFRNFAVQKSTYDRFFSNLPATFERSGEFEFATLETDRLPLAQFVDAIVGLQRTITAPNTGTAGLKNVAAQ